MDLNLVIEELGLKPTTELEQLLRVQWDDSQQSMPAGGLPFLTAEAVRGGCGALPLPEEFTEAAVAASDRIGSNAALRALAWHYHHCLFHCAGYPHANIKRWPPLVEALQEDAGLFYALVALSGLPGLAAVNLAHSVPPGIVSDTLTQFGPRILDYRDKHGKWGLDAHGIPWLLNHLRGQLYRLGRLQFQFGFFDRRLRVFRHRDCGTVLALSEGGVRYLGDGQLDGEGRTYDTSGGWVSRFVLSEHTITGNPILPTGRALPREVCLATSDWQEVLAPGDPILYVHIPGGSAMDYELCGQSFRAALEFFPSHFPQRSFVAFCCCSWVLDSQLEALLPPTSNMVRLQREGYLFPAFSDDLYLLRSVFGGVPEDLAKAPRDTTLQRAVLDRLAGGGGLRAGAGGFFLLTDDFNWGSEVYRRQKLPW